MRDEADAAYPTPEKATAFHHTVAQLLFLAVRARRDIQIVVVFLTNRMENPDEDDWEKLRQVLQYLHGTKTLELTLSIKSMSILKWYIGGSHNVHWDARGHGVAMLTMGEGAVMSYS